MQWVTADLLTGPKVADAVADVDAIVHCATNGRHPADDVIGTRRLIDTALLGGSPHLIYMSIVGVDKIPLKYYRHKLGVEGIVERSGLPWSVLRATQFHDLVADLLRAASRLPVMTLPAGVSVQSIDTSDVAGRLIEMIAAGPQGGRPTSAVRASRPCRTSPSNTCGRPARSGNWRRSGHRGRSLMGTATAGTSPRSTPTGP